MVIDSHNCSIIACNIAADKRGTVFDAYDRTDCARPSNTFPKAMIKILAIPGSLRSNSSSHLILKAIISFAPTGTQVEVYDGLVKLPHFDDAQKEPVEVIEFKDKVRTANSVIICTPEYAFGIPGSLKNALDWTVGSGEFVDKPVGLITASSVGDKGHSAMLLVLSAISAKVIKDATLLISAVRSKIAADGTIIDTELLNVLRKVIPSMVKESENMEHI